MKDMNPTDDTSDSKERLLHIRGYIQKFPDYVDNEINNNTNKHSLRGNIQGYGSKTHYTDSQNSDTTARVGRELYNWQFLLQAASPETFGYTVHRNDSDMYKARMK
jgi:hypothetical protein